VVWEHTMVGTAVGPMEGIMADIMEDIVGGIMEDTTADIQDIMAGVTTQAISHIIGDIRSQDGPMRTMGGGLTQDRPTTIHRRGLGEPHHITYRSNSNPIIGTTVRICRGTTHTLKVARAAG
jgi:hypothetical protein